MSGLVRLAELKPPEGAHARVWRLYSEGRKPLPLYIYRLEGYWWATTVPGEVRLRLGGATAIAVAAETPQEAADALWRLLDALGIEIEYPVLAGLA